MKASGLLSALLTIGVVVYLLLTEWTWWKSSSDQGTRATEDIRAHTEDGPGQRAGKAAGKASRARSAGVEPRGRSSGSSHRGEGSEDGAGDEPGAERRSGTAVYRIDQPCDCAAGSSIMLETVEINDEHTVLTFLNAERAELRTYGPGHESAPFLLEWRYVDDNRPRHDLVAVEGIAVYPESSRPRNFRYIFPRISDQVTRFQLSGRPTQEMDYLQYTSIELADEMSPDELRRFESYKRCGFDGPDTIRVGQTRIFSAHAGGDGLRWDVKGRVEVADAEDAEVKIRGRRRGKAEVCLSQERDGQACRSCREIEVIEAASVVEPDFRMTSCGGLPSRPPHWRFTIDEPLPGVEYEWSLPARARSFGDSERAHTLIMAPSLRPGTIEVSVRARYSPGEEASYSRRFHSVYSCPEPAGRAARQ